MTITTPDASPLHILALGGIDHTYRAIEAIGHQYSLIQSKSLVTEYQIGSAVDLLLTDYQDIEAMIAYARVLNTRKKIDYVLCLSEYPQLAAAAITEDLGIIGNCNSFAVESSRNKFKFRELLEQHNLPNIPFELIDNEASLVNFLAQVGGKAVIKPVYGAGSAGVHLIDQNSDLTAALEFVRRAGHGDILAEAFIEGQEYSVESMSINGQHEVVAITAKTVCESAHFVELAHVQPVNIGVHREPLNQLISNILSVLQHKTGPAHTEIKITEQGIQVIESQVRLGGDQIWEMTMLTSGVDVAIETVYALIGKTLPQRVKKHEVVAVQYFNLPATNLSKQTLLERYQQVKQLDDVITGVIRVEIELLSSEPTKVIHSGERSGYILVYANSVVAAQALVQAECDKMQRCVEG